MNPTGGSLVEVRDGCMVVLECSGDGEEVLWRVFGQRQEIQNGTDNKFIKVSA